MSRRKFLASRQDGVPKIGQCPSAVFLLSYDENDDKMASL
jgi:hypothetical protein